MSLRNTFNRKRGTPSLVRREALWGAVFFVCGVFSARVAAANQLCSDLLQTGKYTIDLDKCRPAPISTGEKRLVLKSLPAAGAVTHLTKGEQRKLKDLTPVLHLHERDGVYELRVISVPQAWIGLYGRAVLLISLPALELLRAEELQALVAHEIGHEYLWQEYAVARKDKDVTRLRELELKCDAIAVLTLQRIECNPNRLILGLEKLSWYNRERFGSATNESGYPSLRARRDLVEAMSRLPGYLTW